LIVGDVFSGSGNELGGQRKHRRVCDDNKTKQETAHVYSSAH
jgi:hypothetical protein